MKEWSKRIFMRESSSQQGKKFKKMTQHLLLAQWAAQPKKTITGQSQHQMHTVEARHSNSISMPLKKLLVVTFEKSKSSEESICLVDFLLCLKALNMAFQTRWKNFLNQTHEVTNHRSSIVSLMFCIFVHVSDSFSLCKQQEHQL